MDYDTLNALAIMILALGGIWCFARSATDIERQKKKKKEKE